MSKLYRKIVINNFGASDVLKLEIKDLPISPENITKKIKIAVSHVGVNRADVLLREGKYHLRELPVTPGLEASGVVLESCGNWKKGDRVLIFKAENGLYTDYVEMESDSIIKIPDSVSLLQAASIPLNWITAFDCLYRLLNIKEKKSIAIFAAASGVGQAAIQMAKSEGLNVFAFVSSNEKANYLRQKYNIKAFAITSPDQIEQIIFSLIEDKKVDVTFDLVGGAFFQTALKITQDCGVVAQAANPTLENSLINVRDFYPRNLTIHGFQFANLIKNKKDQFKNHLCEILNRFESGQWFSLPISEFEAEQAANAHQKIEDRSNTDKIIIHFGRLI